MAGPAPACLQWRPSQLKQFTTRTVKLMLQRITPARSCAATHRASPCRLSQHQALSGSARPQQHWVCQASSSEASTDTSAQPSEEQQGPIKVPLSELPPADHKRAYQALNKNQRKTGLPKLLGDTLNGLSITVIGDDTRLNDAFARALATELGWFPTSSQAILTGMKKGALKGEELIEAEQGILKGLRTQRRVVVATVRGGATSVTQTYRDLWGSLIIRIDEEDKYSLKPKTPERTCHALVAEVQLVIRPMKGFGKTPMKSPTEKAQAHMNALLKQMAQVLHNQPDLVEKKERYMELGFRGDWPELQPASWNPLIDSLERKPLETP